MLGILVQFLQISLQLLQILLKCLEIFLMEIHKLSKNQDHQNIYVYAPLFQRKVEKKSHLCSFFLAVFTS